MRVLMLTNYFPPEVGAASHLFHELAEGLADRGHEVTVVTGFPRYHVEERHQGIFRRERVGRADVVRIASSPFDQGGGVRRGLDHLYVAASLFGGALIHWSASSSPTRPHVVLVYSPPLTLGLAAWAFGRLSGTPVVVNVQDLFPQYAVDLGILKSGWLVRAFERLETFVYRRADAVLVHSPGNREHVLRRGGRPAQTSVISNWVDTKHIRPDPEDNRFRQECGLGGRYVVQYAGTMGYAQDLDTIVEAAHKLASDPCYRFQLIGEGVERRRLEQRVSALGLDNVLFTDTQPRERYPAVLHSADLCLASLAKDLRTPVVPSKLMSIMAAGKPVILSAPLDGDAPMVVREAECGLCVPAGDAASLAAAIVWMRQHPERASAMGAQGRSYALQHFSLNRAAFRIENVFLAVTASRSGVQPSRSHA